MKSNLILLPQLLPVKGKVSGGSYLQLSTHKACLFTILVFHKVV